MHSNKTRNSDAQRRQGRFVYYAFKQSETASESGTASTGWETFLAAVIRAGFGVSGTWPMRSELATRRELVAALQRELPEALRHLQAGNIAPVDLAQAAIGPGMAVFTRYTQVLDAQGKALTVREALALINETLDTALAEQEGDFDPDSRWALAWFSDFGFDDGEFGRAETLSKAKNTSVSGLASAGILLSAKGKVRLLRPNELPAGWDPATDTRLTHWETVHHLIRALNTGEVAAAGCWPRFARWTSPEPTRRGNLPTASTPSANGKNAPPTRSATMPSCKPGRS
jgi:putative DNA methylase